MEAENFNIVTALRAALALKVVLERRTHVRKYLDEEYIVPGSLGEAVKLPKIISMLRSKLLPRREKGVIAFSLLWATLSQPTRSAVLKDIGWYDPKSLDWDDPRSNRRPDIKDVSDN